MSRGKWRVFKGWKGSTKSIPCAIGGIIDVKAIGVLVYNKNDSLSLRFIKITSFVLMYIYVKIDVYPVKNCT